MIGIAASDFFCINLSTIAHLLGLSESLAGVTFLAFGNGSPDVFSTFAAMSTNSGSLAVGELIGAASFITAVVAGAMAFVRPFKVARRSFVRDVCFFILAASFSMGFLVDGRLYLWEAIAMVGLYAFYVLFVVIWHWWFNRRKKRRQVEAAARAHFVTSNSEVADFPAYHDVDEPQQDDERPAIRRGFSADDVSLLELGASGADDDDDEEGEEDMRKRTLGEINNEMRVARPRMRERSGTHNPVRPSLIGALEFRSVLSGLQRSGNIQAFPLHRRRSDDDRFFDESADYDHNNDARSMTSEPASRGAFSATVEHDGSWNAENHHAEAVVGLRSRAISAPDPSMIRQAAQTVPSIDLLGPLAEDDSASRASPRRSDPTHLVVPTSPSATLSPPGSSRTSRSSSPAPSHTQSQGSLHLTVPDFSHPTSHTPSPITAISPGTTDPPNGRMSAKPPKPVLRIPSGTAIVSPHSRSGDASPTGRSPSILLPSPRLHLADHNPIDEMFRSSSPKPPRWWPSRFLPTPFELWASLFPTMCGWTEKNWWERLLGVVAAPSVFLLTVTLPVVETEPEEAEPDDDIPDLTLPSTTNVDRSYASTVPPILIEPEEDEHEAPRSQELSKGLAGHGNTAAVAASQENLHHSRNAHETDPLLPGHHTHHRQSVPAILSPIDRHIMQSPDQLPVATKLPSSRDWNRWLVILQIFIAPFFTAVIFWAKMHEGEPRELLQPVLIALVVSLVFLAVILVSTTPDKPPAWRTGLCFVGFIVSITWISTIADEVVGVLKSIGVILNISDAILGLTIFAVGNSLGDLVADYTVAKLGYPVMALSACFGGPMLNILLGIGLSGTYLTIKHARKHHAKHPGKELKFKPYEIEVSRTLMISGATLLITLLGLLIIVPVRRWKMDRFVGWCLIALWSVSTIINVVVEVLGVGASL